MRTKPRQKKHTYHEVHQKETQHATSNENVVYTSRLPGLTKAPTCVVHIPTFSSKKINQIVAYRQQHSVTYEFNLETPKSMALPRITNIQTNYTKNIQRRETYAKAGIRGLACMTSISSTLLEGRGARGESEASVIGLVTVVARPRRGRD